MKTKSYFIAVAIITFLFGSALGLIPDIMLSFWSIDTDVHLLFITRRFAISMLAFSVIFWMVRNTSDQLTQKSLTIGIVVFTFMLGVSTLYGVITETINISAVGSFLIEIIVAVWGIILLFKR